MGVRYAQNIIEESDPIFFIAAIVGKFIVIRHEISYT